MGRRTRALFLILFSTCCEILTHKMASSNPTDQQTAKPAQYHPWVRRSNAHDVIVFVHGVMGDEISTWTNPNGSYWPRMLTIDPAFDGVDVYVYGYPSPALKRSFTVDEIADNMRLILATDGVLKYDRITFVSHSMGGVVTRQFLIKYQSVMKAKIRLLYFLATPTAGTPYAKLASLISRNSQFRALYPMDSDSFLAPLESHWLAAGMNDLKSYCSYETQSYRGFIIVEMSSATHLCNQRLDPVDDDHIGIAKPGSTRSIQYLALKEAIAETARPISAAVVAPKPAPKIAERALIPLIKEDVFSTFIVFMAGNGGPILVPHNRTWNESDPVSGHFATLTMLVLETLGLTGTDQWPTSKGLTDPNDRVRMFLEVLQYRLVSLIWDMESSWTGIHWSIGNQTKTSSILAIAPPRPVLYPPKKLLSTLKMNRVFATKEVIWEHARFPVPKDSTVTLIDESSTSGLTNAFKIEDPEVFSLEFSIEPGPAMNGAIPRTFPPPLPKEENVVMYSFRVRMRFVFFRHKNTDPLEQQYYEKWAMDLFERLKREFPAE
jgi:pimeloyl-ACP methyl ester carboxylesterase